MDSEEIVGIDPIIASKGNKIRAIEIDGAQKKNLGNRHLGSGDISETERESVVSTAARTLGNCPDPGGPPSAVTGLALGKVQSGKTLSYTTLIALAIDNGYRITIVLAGTKKPLLEQTFARLSYDLDVGNGSVVPFKNPPPGDSDVLLSVLQGGRHALIVCLKSKKRLSDLHLLLNSPDLKAFPSLIIDDEGDEASLNTQFRKGKKSTIYESILKVRNLLRVHAYIAYTATPQANLLISGIDALSPDFAVLIQPGNGYCGGSEFFGANSSLYVRKVPVDEADVALASEVTASLKRSIAIFLVGAAIRSLRGTVSKLSMLIHTSNLRVDHEKLKNAVYGLIVLWREKMALPSDDHSRIDLCKLFEEAFNDLKKSVADCPAFSLLEKQIIQEVRLLEVWMVNSLPLGRDPITTPFRLQNNILVGGNMLGRGVTIPGLAVTFITREAQQDTNADTLEQRARWFGYKLSYISLCRIFLTERLYGRYTELLLHEDDFWDALGRNERQGISVRDWPRMLRLDAEAWELRPTRANVADVKAFASEGWDVQGNLVRNAGIASKNIAEALRFFKSRKTIDKSYGKVRHGIVEQCDPEDVIRDLLARIDSEGTDWENSYYEEYIERLFLGSRVQGIDVLLMNGGHFRERSLEKDGRVNLMQGRSPHRQPGDPDYYPGDEYIHDGKMQLQVHFVELKAPESIQTLGMALFIPRDPRYDLKMIVRKGA